MNTTRVRLRVPRDASMLTFPSGDQVAVKSDETGLYADVREEDARLILFSGLAASVPWRELNKPQVDRLKPPSRVSAVRVVDLQRAADLARPIDPFNKGAIARDALAAWRGDR